METVKSDHENVSVEATEHILRIYYNYFVYHNGNILNEMFYIPKKRGVLSLAV